MHQAELLQGFAPEKTKPAEYAPVSNARRYSGERLAAYSAFFSRASVRRRQRMIGKRKSVPRHMREAVNVKGPT